MTKKKKKENNIVFTKKHAFIEQPTESFIFVMNKYVCNTKREEREKEKKKNGTE